MKVAGAFNGLRRDARHDMSPDIAANQKLNHPAQRNARWGLYPLAVIAICTLI